jgi:hypothetical protein
MSVTVGAALVRSACVLIRARRWDEFDGRGGAVLVYGQADGDGSHGRPQRPVSDGGV